MVKLFPKYLNTKDKAAFVIESSVKMWNSTLFSELIAKNRTHWESLNTGSTAEVKQCLPAI